MRNRDGFIPGQHVELADIKRVERARKLARAKEAGASAPVDFNAPWFKLRKAVEEQTGVRPRDKEHAKELMNAGTEGTSEASA